MVAQIDPDDRPNVDELEKVFTLRVISLADMNYETISDDGSRSVVRVTGTVNFELSGENRTVPLNATIALIRKYGRWYLQIKR